MLPEDIMSETLSLAVFTVPVVITPPLIEVTLLFTCPPLIKAESLVKSETLSPLTIMLPVDMMSLTLSLAVAIVPDVILSASKLVTVITEASIVPAVILFAVIELIFASVTYSKS